MTPTFRKTARSERHFSALLLPHLLMSNNFAGCRKLFENLGICDGRSFCAECIEIVAELNPVRDVAEWSDEMESEVFEKQSQVTPDLFLRIGNSALVIEAKFFTYPTAFAIKNQMDKQRDAIRRCVERLPEYASCRFFYLALTVDELTNFTDRDKDTFQMTWSQVIEVLKCDCETDDSMDTKYALRELENAVERSKEKRKSPGRYGRVESIGELLQESLRLWGEEYRYIGYTGGEQALARATVTELENRGHYKYSKCKWNNNWLPLDLVISHYLNLKTQSAPD